MYLYHSITANRRDFYSLSQTYKQGTGICSSWENTIGETKGDGNGYSYRRYYLTGGRCPPWPPDPNNVCPQDNSYAAGPTIVSGYASLATSIGSKSTVIGIYKNTTSWTYMQWGPGTVKCGTNYYDPCSFTCGQPKAGVSLLTNSGTSKYYLLNDLASETSRFTGGIFPISTTRHHLVVGHPGESYGFKTTTAADITSTFKRTLDYGDGGYTIIDRTSTTRFGTYNWQAQRYGHPHGGHVSVPIFKLESDQLAFLPRRSTTTAGWKSNGGTFTTTAETDVGRLGGNYRRIPGAWVGKSNTAVPLFSQTVRDLDGWIGSSVAKPKYANSQWACGGASYTRGYQDITLTAKGATIKGKSYIGSRECGTEGPSRTNEYADVTVTWAVPQAMQGFSNYLDTQGKQAGRTAYFDAAGIIAAVITNGKLMGATSVSVEGADYLKPMIVPTNGAGEAEVFFHEYGKPYKGTWWSRTGPKETDYKTATSWLSSSLGPMTLTTKDGTKISQSFGTFAKYWTFQQVGKLKTPVTTYAPLVAVTGKYAKLVVDATALVDVGDLYPNNISIPIPGMHPNERWGFNLNDGGGATVMLPPLASSAKASFAISGPTWLTGSAKNEALWKGATNYWSWQLLGVRRPTEEIGEGPKTKTWVLPTLGTFELGTGDVFSIVRTLPQTYTDGTAELLYNNTQSSFARLANYRDQPGFDQQFINEDPRPQSYSYRKFVGKDFPATPIWNSYQQLVRGIRDNQYI